ncbi:hypothetical protein BC941DRAFT_432912 [Chlamydoabsidia padenii]|nr:hypothetical protein BC941DRAFT_432912 [Chlamydoabsidia padenii]
MPHYSRQSSRSPSPSDETAYEEELDEFGRVKQRRSNFAADDDRRQHDDSDESDGRRRSASPERRPHYRRRHSSRSPESVGRYISEDDDGSSDDSHYKRYRHRHGSPGRRHRRRSTDLGDRALKKIYIGDLVTGTTESELEQAFLRFGPIKHIKLIEGKEYGFITFEDSSSAQEAISTMDGALIGSQKIRVNRAKMMERSRYGTWMDEDGEKTYHKTAPPLHSLDPPLIQRTLTSYDDLL